MTAQTPEILWYEGEEHSMCSEPLIDYFNLTGKQSDFAEMDTACWRCYVGEWEVRDDRLYLIRIDASCADGIAVTLDSLFPGFPDRVFAHWYSGTIRLPRGKLIDYVHGDYLSTYERDLLLEVEKGILIGRSVRNNVEDDL